MTHRRLGLVFCALASVALAAITRAAAPYSLTSQEMVSLAAKSSSALRAPIVPVTAKPQPSPSGDAHDYVSFARYYWPDPKKPNGLPFVSHDGHHNKEQVALGDHERLFRFAETVEALAAAWQVNHDAAAAQRAGDWLRTWFVAPTTRMNPSLEYAQVRLGHEHNHGSSSGVLDARCLSQVVDALLILHGSPALSADDETKIKQWFSSYLDWLLTANNAREEHAAKNNHGTWFLAQAIPIARYSGRLDVARQLCEEDKARIGSQIKPDGSQPEEIRRVDGLGYSVFNIEAQFQVARHAQALGVDLWNFTAPNGASLRSAVEFLRPYNAKPDTWPTSQNAKLKPGFLNSILAQAAAVWPGFEAPKVPASPDAAPKVGE